MNQRIIEEIEAELDVSFKNFRTRIKHLRNSANLDSLQDDPNTTIPEEHVPPIILTNELGEPEAHCVIDGQYVPEPLAQVIFQQRKLMKEFARLRFLGSEWLKFKRRKANALAEMKKIHYNVIK